ncbi:hypothetical protein EOD41_03490 [Mucilaginibacter limnophilus]|uniref:Uncharacterized protein n=1 Tax=Mucilaginibacter limnophilus TaxID=1932778 RepID=A0A3S2Y414_9SPHI|nr:hypothetical protein [Mucilaginibacter limnophilus]RVU03011.1 hypothetical protein EOD41_03490 [Mucilaginibacter limnophilus]
MTKKQYILLSVSLFISLFIYLFYRTEKTVVNELIIRLVSYPVYISLKNFIGSSIPLNNIFIYSLPEGLWVFCITLTSKAYYVQYKNRYFDCTYIPLALCITLELLQLLHVTNGRFDYIDIAIFVLFWVLARYRFCGNNKKQHLLNKPNYSTLVCVISYGIVYLAHVMK